MKEKNNNEIDPTNIKEIIDSGQVNPVDKEAYEQYLKMLENPILSTRRRFKSHDKKTEIDLGDPYPLLTKRIAHLDKKEQKEIMAKKKIFMQVNSKATNLKQKAFGVQLGRRDSETRRRSTVDSKKDEILELFGRMFTVEEVLKICVVDWKLPVTKLVLTHFRRDNLDVITEKINNFKIKYDDIRLGVKRSRLEELTWMYGIMKEEFSKHRSVPVHRSMLLNIEAVRKEIEGDIIRFDGNMNFNVESQVNIHLQKEVFKQLNIYQIIISRVAARQKCNPMRILKQLSESVYNKYSGIMSAPDLTDENMISYPSLENYDFDKIKFEVINYERGEKMSENKQENEIFREKEKLEKDKKSLKDILLGKIRDHNEELIKRKILVEKTLVDNDIKEITTSKKK